LISGIKNPDREENKKLLQGKEPKLVATIKKLSTFLKEKNLIKTGGDILPAADGRYLSSLDG